MEQFDATESYSRRNRILDIFSDRGPLSLKNLKEEYELRAGEKFPYAGDLSTVQQLFLEFGIQYDHKQKKFFVKKEYRLRPKPDVLYHGTPYAKRSRSAPFKEDDEEDYEIKKVMFRSDTKINGNGAAAAGDENANNRVAGRQSRQIHVKDNRNNKQRKNGGEQRSKSEYRSQLLGKPHICGTIIVSDDFFIGITTRILNFKADRVDGVLQSGFCVSGLTIKAAYKMINETINDDRYKTMVIYLGSMDILQGRYLIHLMQDISEFLALCIRKKIHPIVCTLAPLPSIEISDDDRLKNLKGFNEYLRTNKLNLPVLDVYSCMIKPNTEEFEEKYYQEKALKTSGSNQPLVLWSFDGSRRVYDFVLKNIGFALMSEERRVFNYC